MIKIGILGYGGRMGRLITEEIAATDTAKLVGGVVEDNGAVYQKAEGILITPHADEVVAISDVLIEFTGSEKATTEYAKLAAAHGKALVSGTTGLSEAAQAVLKQASSKIPVLYASNTSVSLTALKPVVELAAKLLGNFDYDVSIIDEHHRMKKDAPSGTAKTLGEAVLRGNSGKKKVEYAAIRAGGIVGEHDVVFAGQGETIRLRHSVADRRIFAQGALQAALWLHGKPAGMYGMEDVLGIKSK